MCQRCSYSAYSENYANINGTIGVGAKSMAGNNSIAYWYETSPQYYSMMLDFSLNLLYFRLLEVMCMYPAVFSSHILTLLLIYTDKA